MTWVVVGFGVVLGALLPRVVAALERWAGGDAHDLGTVDTMRARREAWRAEGRAVRVLVACEFSGIVRDAFLARGHEAWSCDLLPTEQPGPHLQDDVSAHLADGWDVMIAHPPCTHLAVSGARWFKDKRAEQESALAFVRALMAAPIARICIENPISVISSRIRRPDQIIQPWQFGQGK